jgi:hypothetical protein
MEPKDYHLSVDLPTGFAARGEKGKGEGYHPMTTDDGTIPF